jgi:hypothetical protein
LSGVFAGIFALLVRVMLLFESNEMSYFDGLEKVYSDDLIDKLICGWIILVLALLSGFLFTFKSKIIYQSGHSTTK